KRLVTLAGATVELLQEIGSGGTATTRQRIEGLRRHRLTASRFNRFATCSGAPSHRLPRGSGQGIVAGQLARRKSPLRQLRQGWPRSSAPCRATIKLSPAQLIAQISLSDGPCRPVGPFPEIPYESFRSGYRLWKQNRSDVPAYRDHHMRIVN